MALYAFDGTWNTEKSEEDKTYENTNVVRFFRAYNKGRATRTSTSRASARASTCSASLSEDFSGWAS